MQRLHPPRIAVLLLLGGAACAPDTPRGPAVETLANGAVQVTNTGSGTWTPATAWKAVEVLRIGRLDGDGPDLFGEPRALEADAEGTLYVLDAQAGEVRVFDAGGRHVRTMGRPGAGPGELRQPAGISLAGDGSLWVADPGNNRYTVFDPGGALRTTHRRESALTVVPWPGRVDLAGRIWDLGLGTVPAGGSPTLTWSDPAAGAKGEIALPEHEAERFRHVSERTSVTAVVPFAPALQWVLDPEGRLWSGVSDRYRLHLHHPGGDTLRVVELAVAPVPVSSAERDSAVAGLSWFTAQGGRVDASRLPRVKPAFTAVYLDDRDHLFVRPSLPENQPQTVLDVFDPQGVYLGRLELPEAPGEWAPLVVRGDRLYTMLLAPEGHPQVVGYRLEGRD